jgi:hypothetical protein
LFGVQLGKGFRKRNDNEMVDLLPGKELDLFPEGIDQPDLFGAAFDDLSGVRVKGDDEGLAADAGRFFAQLPEDMGMTGVDAVESTDCDHGLVESWQLAGIVVDLHGDVNVLPPSEVGLRLQAFIKRLPSAQTV